MQIHFQTLDVAKPKIQKRFTTCPTASISAIYRKLRKSSSLSFFGDYPILATIITTVSSMGVVIKPAAIQRAIRYSDELKGKKLLFNQLLNLQITARNTKNKPLHERFTSESINSLSKKENHDEK